MAQTETKIPTPEDLLGGYVVEIFMAILLYGISVAQAYVYWLNSGKDAPYLRILVGIVMFFETFHSVFAIHMCYHYVITCFGQIANVGNIIWSSGASIASGMLVITLVQSFYIRRIWILSQQNKMLTIIPSVILFLRIGFGFGTMALTYIIKTWPEFRETTGPMFTLSAGIALSATMDLLIAGILIYHLHSSKTGFKETDHLIQHLMAYAVNTGAITMICSIGVVFTFVFQKDSLLFAGLWLMCSKLYANSLLGTLNARQILRKPPSAFSSSEISGRFHATQGPMRPIEIFQESTKVTDGETYQMSHTGSHQDNHSHDKVGPLM